MSSQDNSPDRWTRGLEDAIEIAFDAHRGQDYPSPEREPYVLHLFRVMLAVDGGPARMTAVLHDVLEDTTVTVDDLLASGVPRTVVDAIVALTHSPDDTYDEYIERAAANELARKVKLADLADNLANNQRLPRTADVLARIDRYERAMRRLTSAHGHAADDDRCERRGL
jgi:(p)ppGpp synthase/HD superfamily hydrolase